MRLLATLLLLAAAAPSPEIRYFHYQRPIETPAQAAGQTCLVLDPAIFAHAAPQLADLRLYRGSTETPYVVQAAAPVVLSQQQITPLNLGRRGGQTVFDAAMPAGNYSDIELAVTGHDFIATVTIGGSQTQSSARTRVGSYTIFDLTGQRLGRSTILHLPQSDFRYLHFDIAGPIVPKQVTGLSVQTKPTLRPKYAMVAESSMVGRDGRSSVIELSVPGNTPVDRIVFVPGSEPASFSRDVAVKVNSTAQPQAGDAPGPPQLADYSGNLLRIHRVQDGHRLDEEHLSLDVSATAFDTPARWTITIENGDDAPIQIKSVRLEMTQRNLCFEAAPATGYTLYYGDSALAPPQYDYATLFAPQASAAQATAGPEQINPDYQPRPDDRPFTEKHPTLLWVALALVIALLGLVALRSVKFTAQSPP